MIEKYIRFTKEALPKTPMDLTWEDAAGKKHIVGTVKKFDVDNDGNLIATSVFLNSEKMDKLGISESVGAYSIGFEHKFVSISPILKQAARYGAQISHLYHERNHEAMAAVDDAWQQFRQQAIGFDPEHYRQTIDTFMDSYRETTKKYREATPLPTSDR